MNDSVRGRQQMEDMYNACTKTFNVGDAVEKVGGDYIFPGVVVATFLKMTGARRYVVEDDRGILHIFSEKNLVKV